MTAHAMAGDREKSLEAGMDDHVTKPIDQDQLLAALVKWIKPGERTDSVIYNEIKNITAINDDLPTDLPGIDVANGLKRLGGNKKLYRKLLLKFTCRENWIKSILVIMIFTVRQFPEFFLLNMIN